MTSDAKCRTLRVVLPLLVGCLFSAGTPNAYPQQASGFIPFNRFGISYQKAVGVDLGLVAYHTRYSYQRANFHDISLGVESLFAQRFTFVPKLTMEVGFRSSLFEGATVGGGADVGWQMDFAGGGWRITPKAGITWGSIFRLYYGYHVYSPDQTDKRIRPHRVSFELNIAAFRDFHIGG